MDKFVRSLFTEWRRLQLALAGETFVVAVSGGADSISLALALGQLKKTEKLRHRFVAAHFNHDLRGAESREDEEFVKDFAGKFDFELVCKIQNPQAEIRRQPGNLEQNARRARYAFLRETAENLRARGVLTAHTQNDQAETFLLNLIRGSGLEGLGGMKTIRNLDFAFSNREIGLSEPPIEAESSVRNQKSEIKLIRPLLSWARRESTENFCRASQIEFRHDSMNEDLAFKRVRIRKVLLPLLKDFNPKIIETLAKTANLLRDDFDGLKKSADAIAENFSADERNEKSLDLKELKDLFPSMRRRILRDWLRKARGDLRALDSNRLEAIENLIFSRKSGRVVQMPHGETVTKRRGKLLFEKTKVDKSRFENYNQGLDFKAVENSIENND